MQNNTMIPYNIKKNLETNYYNKTEVELLIAGGSGGSIDLSNYYKKLETYSKAQVDALVASGGADLSDYYTKAQVDSLISAIPETDLTNYYNKTQVNSLIPDISTKQDVLVSATNIKTINGESILGSGDLVISGGGAVDLSDYYKKTETYSKVEVDTKIADIPETDLSGYYNKTQVDAIALDKVDKVVGKQLSTEDYTTAEKTKLSGLNNYIKPISEPISYIDGLQTALGDKVDKVSKQALDSNNALRVTGTTVSLYKGDGTFDSITTQDTIYTLPTATSTAKGGIELFSDMVQTVASNSVSTTAGRTYGIQLNSEGQAVVNVPWSDTNTVYTHPNSGVTAGTYSKVTVNTQGHITNGSSLLESDIPSLDASKITSGTIDAARLPSFVDDVLEFTNLAGFPTTGEAGKIYIALDTNKTYRWSGSTYVYITSGAVDSVAGKTGVVTLIKGDVGLGNVDNTSDLNKPISTATQTALNLKANLNSPALTGVPTAPTAANGTNTTQIATTAFVLANGGNSSNVATAIAAIPYGGVGSYLFARFWWNSSKSTSVSPGATLAGSNLQPIRLNMSLNDGAIVGTGVDGAVPGTWRCMSGTHTSNTTTQGIGLWLRIA